MPVQVCLLYAMSLYNPLQLYSQNFRRQSLQLFRINSIPTTFRLFRVLTSEMLDRRLPMFMLLLWQRQHIIVVDAVDY